MGFYATDTCSKVVYKHGHALEKSRLGFFSSTRSRAGFFASQPVEAHWENEATHTKTVSGIFRHYEYSPFGETIVATGPLAKENKFRFSTKYFDDETGLGNYGYRYYSPSLGRWLNRDPIGERGGNNLYRFVSNDPVRKIDYLGQLEIPSWLNDLLSSPTDPADQSPPGLYECPIVDGFYRHCVASCRVNRILNNPLLTMLIALYAGGDFHWGDNHTYDQLADVVGIINSATLSCRNSCLGPTKAIIELKCCGKNNK